MTKSPKIAVIYYSMYGHIQQMAHAAVQGIKNKGGDATLLQFPETLSEEILGKMGAPPKEKDVPVLKANDLEHYDAFVFAFPTRYGRAVSQVSALFDATGQLWMRQALSGKMATIIVSTGTQHGGQETTVLTTLPYLAHHGIIYVPLGYINPVIMDMEHVQGGSPYGAGTLAAADGSRQPSKAELDLSTYHAEHFTSIVSKYIN